MIKTIERIKKGEDKEKITTDLLFEEIQPDTVGRSASNATWGKVYSNDNGNKKEIGIALYKEYDYDYPNAAKCEKIWSIIGRELLSDELRVANVDIVKGKGGYEEIISYRLMNNDREDMIHIGSLLYKKFQREEIKAKKNIFSIDEILECIKTQVTDQENYKEIEKAVIHILLLDAITNNPDRHPLNWALVRDEKTNRYAMGVFDHSVALKDMLEPEPIAIRGIWTSTYIAVGKDFGKTNIGSIGDTIVKYIADKYPEYFEDFYDRLEKKLPNILKKIQEENLKIQYKRLEMRLQQKKSYLRKIKDRGEIEYE